jgi:hypothetical protein
VEVKEIKVALSGFNKCGKDHCADYLKNEHGYKVFSFSDQHKNIARQLFPWLEFDYPSSEKEEVVYTNPETGEGYTPRKVWEMLDLLPQIDPSINIAPLDEQIEKCREIYGLPKIPLKILIKDVRRPSELEYIKKNGYVLIYIHGSNTEMNWTNLKYMKQTPQCFQSGIWEQSDFKIYNDMKTENVIKQLKEIISNVGR